MNYNDAKIQAAAGKAVYRAYKIVISNPGNHICNALLNLSGSTYNTRDDACEAIYAAMYDVIDSEYGCEMVNRPDGALTNDELDRYINSCHEYIMREGYASEDGVSASVELCDAAEFQD